MSVQLGRPTQASGAEMLGEGPNLTSQSEATSPVEMKIAKSKKNSKDGVASFGEVDEEVKIASVVHFACHGQPQESGSSGGRGRDHERGRDDDLQSLEVWQTQDPQTRNSQTRDPQTQDSHTQDLEMQDNDLYMNLHMAYRIYWKGDSSS